MIRRLSIGYPALAFHDGRVTAIVEGDPDTDCYVEAQTLRLWLSAAGLGLAALGANQLIEPSAAGVRAVLPIHTEILRDIGGDPALLDELRGIGGQLYSWLTGALDAPRAAPTLSDGTPAPLCIGWR